MRDSMQEVVICEAMGWTYQQYLEQPTWFIKLLSHKLTVDAERQATPR